MKKLKIVLSVTEDKVINTILGTIGIFIACVGMGFCVKLGVPWYLGLPPAVVYAILSGYLLTLKPTTTKIKSVDELTSDEINQLRQQADEAAVRKRLNE